jgi:UDP-N-acetylglucosamine 2-epimerase (non-hydrolysing)
MEVNVNHALLQKQINLANQSGRPLYLIAIATKPCYIKLASLVLACQHLQVPYVAIDIGQHYEATLTSAKEELNYNELIAVYFNIRGSLLSRTKDTVDRVSFLDQLLKSKQLKVPAIPVISGDTSTAAIFPLLWYFQTGIRGIHVEAGLRSLSPFRNRDGRYEVDDLFDLQKDEKNWLIEPDEPFPEAVDTRIASVVSQLFFAPVARNARTLLKEGISEELIVESGSLSADAVDLIDRAGNASVFDRYPFLSDGKWLRVDVHRRENMTLGRLTAVLTGVAAVARSGCQVVLVMSNALSAAIKYFKLEKLLEENKGIKNFRITELWPYYAMVIEFMKSQHCMGIYTDSGGLQEEAHILKVPCATSRFSTDRPETILDVRSNLLIPPISHEIVANMLEAAFLSNTPIHSEPYRSLYHEQVGLSIAKKLSSFNPLASAVGVDIFSPGSSK